MSNRCSLRGVGIQFGNNVSHSNRKTRRRFMPNMQKVSFLSEALGKTVTLRITASTLRTVEHNGGFDNYLLTTSATKLTEEGRKLKRQIKKAVLSKKQ